eukprot:5348739-Pleurochrysis_carterae.AAC.1
MTLVLGGKTISVPQIDTLRDAGAIEFNNNEFSQRTTYAPLATTAFTFTATLPGKPTIVPRSRTSACLPTAPSIGAP